MQNRRIAADDHRGMGEYLNETDAEGHGIRVPATYYLEIIKADERESNQRLVQMKTDNPAQYFFNFKASLNENEKTYPGIH